LGLLFDLNLNQDRVNQVSQAALIRNCRRR
jgi:hypothetical protein